MRFFLRMLLNFILILHLIIYTWIIFFYPFFALLEPLYENVPIGANILVYLSSVIAAVIHVFLLLLINHYLDIHTRLAMPFKQTLHALILPILFPSAMIAVYMVKLHDDFPDTIFLLFMIFFGPFLTFIATMLVLLILIRFFGPRVHMDKIYDGGRSSGNTVEVTSTNVE